MARWVRDLPREAQFDIWGWKVEYREQVKIEDIDRVSSLKNNARLGEALDEEHIEKIATSMSAGHRIPAVVLRKKRGLHNLAVLAGNHRVESADLNGDKTVAAYVVECSDEDAERFIRSDNRSHGLGQKQEESVIHIHDLQQRYSHLTVAELARAFSIPTTKAQNAIRAINTRVDLEKLSINCDNMPQQGLLELNKIRHNDTVIQKAAQLAVAYDMPVADIAEMVAEVKKQRGQVRQMTVLDNWADTLRRGKKTLGKGSRNAPKNKLLKSICGTSGSVQAALKRGLNGGPIKHINDIGLNPEEAQRILDDWAITLKLIDPILRECREYVRQNNGKVRHAGSAR